MNDARLIHYLRLIKSSGDTTFEFIAGLSAEDFMTDRLRQHAVAMSLSNIGEHVARIMDRYPEFVRAHPEIPWSDIRGMRNRIVHGYAGLEFPTVWETVQTFLPELMERVANLLPPPAS